MNSKETNYLIKDGDLVKGSIVRLKSYQTNQLKGKWFGANHTRYVVCVLTSFRILIVIGLEVLKECGVPEKIGQPESLEKVLALTEQSSKPVPTATTAPTGTSAASCYGVKPQRTEQLYIKPPQGTVG